MKKLILTSLFLTVHLFSHGSHAALFDDTEARKKILDLEKNMQTQNQATQAALAELKSNQQALEQRITALEGVAKNGLIEMQTQVETLKLEISQLTGDLELARHNLDLAQQRQKDLYTDTDARLRKLETGTGMTGQAPVTSESAVPVVADKETEEPAHIVKDGLAIAPTEGKVFTVVLTEELPVQPFPSVTITE
jgi:hypothetical protein